MVPHTLLLGKVCVFYFKEVKLTKEELRKEMVRLTGELLSLPKEKPNQSREERYDIMVRRMAILAEYKKVKSEYGKIRVQEIEGEKENAKHKR